MSDQFDSSKSEMIMTDGDEEFERPVAIEIIRKIWSSNCKMSVMVHIYIVRYILEDSD